MACRERKNVNLPGVVVDLPTLTKKDEDDLVNWGIPNDIDFIAASFVRKGQDLDNIRRVRGAYIGLCICLAVLQLGSLQTCFATLTQNALQRAGMLPAVNQGS